MTYDQWKTLSPDDELGRYLCGGRVRGEPRAGEDNEASRVHRYFF